MALHNTGDRLWARLNAIGEGTRLKVTDDGSIMCFHFTQTSFQRIKSPADVTDVDVKFDALLLFFSFKIQAGYYIARRGFVALSLAVTYAAVEGFLKAIQDFVVRYPPLL